MARKRMIDPTIWEDEDFGRLTMAAKILFIGLFSNADDEGRLRANPAYIKSTIFMYDQTTIRQIEDLLQEVTSLMRSVKRYTVEEKHYIQLMKWEEYQKQHKDRILPSTFPAYDDSLSDNVGQVSDNVGLSKDKLSKDKLSKDSIPAAEPTGILKIKSKKRESRNPCPFGEDHNVCGIFLQSLASLKNLQDSQWINYPKQLTILHKLLSLGYDFDVIYREAVTADRSNFMWDKWDVATIASALERRGKETVIHATH